MKSIIFERAAIDELVSSRYFQSTEFEQGTALSELLKGNISEGIFLSPSLLVTKIDNDVFISANKIDGNSKYLVIDTEQSKIFDQYGNSDSLVIFQKLMRFVKKIWTGGGILGGLNLSERLITGTSKAVLFPFFGFRNNQFRVTVEREPLAERLEKRGLKGSFLLVYKSGFDSTDAKGEAVSETNFRKVVENISEFKAAVSKFSAQKTADAELINELQVANLDENEVLNPTGFYRHYADWLSCLTLNQNRFVKAEITGAHRIEGAAGTGKTLSLILKALYNVRQAETQDRENHIVFITHSAATKESIIDAVRSIDSERSEHTDRLFFKQTLRIQTLSDLCAEILKQSISETEFIDRDAMDSKELQHLYIYESLDQALKNDYKSHEKLLSNDMKAFLSSKDSWAISAMLQHEFSVVIKGRASFDFEKYKKIPPLKYGIPIASEADKGFVFYIFNLYQDKLGDYGQFDNDDVVLSALAQLDSPIWRRRRKRDGYDAVFIDETHLFNINELQLFHYFTKGMGPYPIIYSVDKAQAIGDKGWTNLDINEALTDHDGEKPQSEKIRTIFRSSPDIIKLAFSIVSSGATLFTNFDNPIDGSTSSFTENDEKLCAKPAFINFASEDAMIEGAFARAEELHRSLKCPKGSILIVTLDEALLKKLNEYAEARNKPIQLLKKRGDSAAVKKAIKDSLFVLGHADYVGGLEFSVALLVGIDNGRVPPVSNDQSENSKSFLSYVSHNRLYVALTRAKYRVEMLGEKARGISKIIPEATQKELLEFKDG